MQRQRPLWRPYSTFTLHSNTILSLFLKLLLVKWLMLSIYCHRTSPKQRFSSKVSSKLGGQDLMASGPICELANISTSGKLGHYSFYILNKDIQVNLKSTNRAPASAGLFTNFILKSASRKNTKNFKLGLGTFFDGPIKIN